MKIERTQKKRPFRPLPGKKRLLEEVRERIRARHLSGQTEHVYVYWMRRFIVFCGKRHPRELGAEEVERFLTYIAVELGVAASTQNQALCALIFLYRDCLGIELEGINALRAKTPINVPVVYSQEEVRKILERLDGTYRLMTEILYGCGLRLQELLTLRVKDLDLSRKTLLVCRAKGGKDRVVPLPESCLDRIRDHLTAVRRLHESDQELLILNGPPPGALVRKYPQIETSLAWKFVFPSKRIVPHPVTGKRYRFDQLSLGAEEALQGFWSRLRTFLKRS